MRARLDSVAPHLVVAFVSPHHESEYRLLPSLVRDALGDGHLLGCSAGGVIGGGRELEEQPGLSLTAAVLPGVLDAFDAVARFTGRDVDFDDGPNRAIFQGAADRRLDRDTSITGIDFAWSDQDVVELFVVL